MLKKELVALCLALPDVYEDYPFDENWAVVRHRTNRRIFAWVFEREGRLCINLKCEPMKAEFWRSVYPCVTPGFHLNKTHWNTVAINEVAVCPDLEEMILDSYRLTKPKRGGIHK